MDEQIKQIIRNNLSLDLYFCSRDWKAWQHGTMTQHDFHKANEEEQYIDEFAQEIIDLIKALPNAY